MAFKSEMLEQEVSWRWRWRTQSQKNPQKKKENNHFNSASGIFSFQKESDDLIEQVMQ